ncbi:phosphatase PAP2 family protein [Clostridium cellulovorans]|uniref:Phosphoesterase PA-phosphatase related n=1 Tax=Clostridium cellulovorans (strain ATCC 35296 / DSM 3052 / OCM 3 / 743B) TaxID=573061 RepID=D9SKR2_CLOC7|nr:phosphatase PAP2 family protein [Clostridium cellulovorans]ADL53484.1 phosphoesterase PA-phosphatase related [Clostridium cellulovorans 743B]
MKKFASFLKKDALLLEKINASLRSPFMDWFMPKITYLGTFYASLIILCLILISTIEDKIPFSLTLVISMVLTSAVTQGVKRTVNRNRPYNVLLNLTVSKIGIDKYSFPSGHTSNAFALAVITFCFFPYIGVLALFLAILVALSRMYLGVHYPTDVAIGFIIGTLSSLIIYFCLIV